MKKALLFLLLIATISIQAQTTTMGGKKTTIENLGGFITDSTLTVPRKYATNYVNLDSIARLWLEPAPLSLYYHNGFNRIRIADSVYVATAISAINPSQHTYIFKALSVNMAATGTTLLGITNASSGRFIATSFSYVIKSTSGTVVIAPIINIGFTPTAYNDIANGIALTSTPVLNRSSVSSAGSSLTTPATTSIFINVTTAATFSTTGIYMVDIYIQGYYEIL